MRISMELDVFKKKNRNLKSKLSNIPGYERKYREILRQQEIKEELYIYLLQKREENEIAMASTIGTVNVMDEPYSIGGPIAPKKLNIFAAAAGIGFILPILIIYLKSLLDTKVKSAEDLEKLGLPYIGEIPFHEGDKNLITVKGERSPTGEALRMLRVNMNFMFNDESNGARTIFVTSTIAGEGKTFTSINLASSIALTDKKVVLLSLDLRKPKLSKYLTIEDKQGVTDYIVNDQLDIDDICQSLPQNTNLDVILSGSIPPNPSELLSSKKMLELFDLLRSRYDYIVVDNAPVGLVSDVLTVMPQADLLLYVVRFGKLEKEALKIAKKLSEESKVKNMATVLNGTKKGASGYGGYGYGYSYGYGYGYGYMDQVKKPWYKRFMN
jgi:capsular exopolysaccharide synthesis family protein